MPDSNPDVRVAIEHSIKTLSRWTLGLYLTVALVISGFVLVRANDMNRVEAIAENNRQALCLFVADLERRMEDTKDYLDKHPGKEPIPGISRADLRRSLQGQRATLVSFESLEC